jgi:GDP-4-dehydro-6-deoxy-D-mannose reductase
VDSMSGQRVLVTGVCGFTGRHLVDRLNRSGEHTIIGVDRPAASNLRLDAYHACDLADSSAVAEVVAAARPDVVYHLAGVFGGLPAEEIDRINVGGTAHLFAALRRHAHQDHPVRVVAIGSAAEVGSAGAASLPVTETASCAPESPYGHSKWRATQLALAEPPDGPLRIVVARSFNLSGPGLSPLLSLGNFVRQVVAVARGESDAIRCGPLDTRRDFVDVRDAADAYVALMDRGEPGHIYNVCRGCSHRMSDLLEALTRMAGVSTQVHSDTSLRRAGDLVDIYGDSSKIARAVGWRARIAMEQSLADMLAAAGSPVVRPPAGQAA